MRILFYCGHPAHFHLIKNTYKNLSHKGYDVNIVIKKKDILEKLLKNNMITYFSISNQEYNSFFLKGIDSILRFLKYLFYVKKGKFDLLVGTSWENSKISKFLNVDSVCLNEDDASVVPFFTNNAYPNASVILTPISCDNGLFNYKSIKYQSYHELGYLHPNNFVPKKQIVEKYFSIENPYFIMRFAKLKAHHDEGIKGINIKIAKSLIKILEPFGKIFITSERELESELEPYRMNINPIDMHHVMAFTKLYIGDSQTMAAEAGVLGIPFVRFNDFVDRIGYLDELENKYKLGYGIKTNEVNKLYETVENLVNIPNLEEIFQTRRKKMLAEKIDFASFLTWFIESYPESVNTMKSNPDYQFNFK